MRSAFADLRAQPLFLRAELGRELLAEVLGLEDRPDFDFRPAAERCALQPLDRFVHRLDVPQPEAGDQLLRFSERSVDHRAFGTGEPDALAPRTWMQPFARLHHAAFTSCSLYLPIADRIFSSGIWPASDSLLAFTITITRITSPLIYVRVLPDGRSSGAQIDTAHFRALYVPTAMKRSRTRVPRLPARARSRPRTAARPKLVRRLPPGLAVRGGDTAPSDQPQQLPPAAVRQPAALPPVPEVAPSIPQTARPDTAVAAPAPQVAPLVPVALPTPQVARPAQPNAMVLRGEVWDVRFDGHTLMLDGTRGLRYMALLIRDARQGSGPLHAKELVALADGRQSDAIELERPDEILDAVAQKQLLARLEEVAAQRDRAAAV